MKIKKRTLTLAAVSLMIGSIGSGVLLTNTTSPVIQASASQIKMDEQAAVKKFQKRYANAQVTSLTLEKKFGQYRYEIEGYDQSKERSMDINAKTGKVIKTSSDRLESDDQNQRLDFSKLINRKKANQVATKAVKGSKGIEWTLDHENGQAVWEVVVQKGRHETEVVINAQNGKVLHTEQDD
ncbi:PepSY domain-containing protein [Limosilactobacillus caecicola]|uniref:PepSY domain-containing protein n=1 Tax=Limosilactobacillus caecicola TaxID=2941332 RepID=UPI00203BC81B|nr:PepSY domain-containing protein [Limosilactobacillus caecicola]